MNIEKVLDKLIEKRKKLIQTTHKYDNYVRLCRTKWSSNYKNDIDVYRKIGAIDLAIELINKHIVEIDIYQYAIQVLPITLYDVRNKYIEKAGSIYLNDRKECARFLIDNYLPICKKDILNCM